ncbi:MAG: hypothetical protein HYY17_16345 [Planctomycetes bacterium]|nr:hypothetical protein [Planctomycetota bacterium]
MGRALFLLGAGCFWAVMMAQLVRREVLPYFEFRDPPSYRSYLRTVSNPEVTKFAVTMSGAPVGEIESVVLPESDGGAQLREWVRLEMPDAKGDKKTLVLASRTTLGTDRRFLRYDSRATLVELPVPVSFVAVRNGNRMRVTLDAKFFRRDVDDIPFDDDAMLSDGIVPYFGGRLSVGKKWRVKTLDMRGVGAGGDAGRVSTTDLYATVEERETILYQGRHVTCHKVFFRRRPTQDEEAMSHIVYVNDSGVVLAITLFVGRYVLDVRLADKRALPYEEARDWKTTVAMPAGFQQP